MQENNQIQSECVCPGKSFTSWYKERRRKDSFETCLSRDPTLLSSLQWFSETCTYDLSLFFKFGTYYCFLPRNERKMKMSPAAEVTCDAKKWWCAAASHYFVIQEAKCPEADLLSRTCILSLNNFWHNKAVNSWGMKWNKSALILSHEYQTYQTWSGWEENKRTC